MQSQLRREKLLGVAYWAGLAPALALLSLHAPATFGRAPVTAAVLVALAACDGLLSESLRSRTDVFFDPGLALALVAVVVAGVGAGVLVLLVPDAIRLAKRGRSFWGLGLLANVTSYVAQVAVAAAVLALLPGHGPGRLAGLMCAGLAALVTSYAVVRAPIVVVRDRAPLIPAIRREFLGLLPVDFAVVAAGAAVALLIAPLGVGVLVVFAALVYVPQVAVAVLLRAPSVASLSIDAAAAIYRAAIADELGLGRADRRLVEQIDALVHRRSHLGPTPPSPHAIMQDALEVSICTETVPRQPAFKASTRAQVVLAARGWARLTARLTPALTHREAVCELHLGSLATDAPEALAAVGRIVERERPLTEHLAGVPRLHRAPLPRRARRQLLPQALARLAA